MGKQTRLSRQVSGYVLRVVELVGIRPHTHHKNLDYVEGKYILSVPDIDLPATWRFTDSRKKAVRFDSFEGALDFYRTQSIYRPRRDDGKPNRPLTAYTMFFEKLEDTYRHSALD